MGDEVTLVSSAEECAKDVYKMLRRTDLMRDRRRPDVPLPDHRARPTSSRPSAAASSGPRSRWPPSSPAAWRDRPVRLTVIGCSGSFAGPDSAACCYLLEADDADGRTWRILLDLGSGALGALQRYVDPIDVDAVLLQPPARRPLPRPVRLLRAAQVPPRRRAAAHPGLGPGGSRAADGARLRPARGPRHDRASSTSASTPGAVDLGPFPVDAVPGRPPGPGLRPAGHRGRPHARLHR